MSQDFEIISLDHPVYYERMDAIDQIDDFKTLEEIFITDEYPPVRMRAYDRLMELFEGSNKLNKLLTLWNKLSNFIGWIPFSKSKLAKNNNIEYMIRSIIKKYDQYGYAQNSLIITDTIDVLIIPLLWNGEHNSRWTQYGNQYQYDMVIKILVKRDGILDYKYYNRRVWTSRTDTPEFFYDKIAFKRFF